MVVLTVDNLKKTFADRTLFSDVSFEIRPGERVGLIGVNGTGKTTSLKLLGGILKPYRGEIHAGGSLGVLPQNPQTLFVKKTVREVKMADMSASFTKA